VTSTDRAEQIARLKQLHDDGLARKAEQKRESTYLAQALADADDIGGRFKKERPTYITGSTPEIVPRLPEGASGAINWPEHVGGDPLGYSVNDMEPCNGSQAELDRSIQQLEAKAAVSASTAAASDDERTYSSSEGPAGAPSIPPSPIGVQPTAGPLFSKTVSASPQARAETAGRTPGPVISGVRSFVRRI
jgi:hypothetical protein